MPQRNGEGDAGPADHVREMIEDLEILVTRTEPLPAERLEIDDAKTYDGVLFRLQTHFRTHPQSDEITVVVHGVQLGAVSRKSLEQILGNVGDAAEPPGVGAGERLFLPGSSTRYRLLVFSCQHCAERTHTMFLDLDHYPECAEHGPMRYVR